MGDGVDDLPAFGAGHAPRLVDTRILGKPAPFTGKDAAWKEWEFVFRAFLVTLDEAYRNELAQARMVQEEIVNETLSGPAQARSVQLYYMLCLQCKGPALELCRAVTEGQGYECWRKLHDQFEPKASGRYMGMLMALLTPDLQGTVEEFPVKLTKWENDVAEYERLAGSLGDAIRTAVLIKHSPPKIRDYLQVNCESFQGNYKAMRAAVLNFCLTRRNWTIKMPEKGTEEDIVPMDVDAVLPGKGKNQKGGKDGKGKWPKGAGKGKDKGKGKSKDKGKGEDIPWGRWCEKVGHKEEGCWIKNPALKGKGKGKGQDKGKGKKVSFVGSSTAGSSSGTDVNFVDSRRRQDWQDQDWQEDEYDFFCVCGAMRRSGSSRNGRRW